MKTILVVDDSDVRLKLRDEFCKLGFNVITAINIQEAKIGFSEGEIDLVIIDDSIKNFNILTILEDVNKYSKNIPIILCLSDCYENSVKNLLSQPYLKDVSFINKKDNIYEIKDKVKEILDV